MRIKNVATELGCSAEWLRDLESRGVIPPAPRDRNGHRRYRDDDVKQLKELLFPSGGSRIERPVQATSG